MPISDAFKRITAPWASGPLGERTAPTDADLDPTLSLAIGWPSSFSTDGGNTPRRRVMNEIIYRRDSALLDIRKYGVLPWDAAVDTLEGGVKQVQGDLYRAIVDNGPSYSNAVNPTTDGQTVWARVPGVRSLPSAPAAPRATSPNPAELDWSWMCALDGGSQVTGFEFQWRVNGATTWGAPIPVTTARYALTGLTNGTAYDARVRARTAVGVSPWSNVGSGTPSGALPGGAGTLALRAEAGDEQATLTWLRPDDGGLAITSYVVQWRTITQAFTTTRGRTVTGLATTVTGLTNDTAYFFRVRAINAQGPGAWSNEAEATPVEPPPPPPQIPDDARPLQVPAAPAGTIIGSSILWQWPIPRDGDRRITSFDLQIRESGDNWPATSTVTTSSCHLQTGATSGTWQARARAINALGSGPWSETGGATVP